MKPAPFDYVAPDSLAEALALLGDGSRPLAGGQSLIPLLNVREVRPARLVDLERVAALGVVRESEGGLRLGAMTRQAFIERSPVIACGWPMLRDAVTYVAHPAIRTRGTIGGSVVHADPAAELCGALLALRAVFHVRSVSGARAVPAHEFFRAPQSTALAPDELLCEIELPALPAGARSAFVEHARTHGDFALAGAAVVFVPGEWASIAVIGGGAVPFRAYDAEAACLAGADAVEVGALAAAGVADGYRRALVAELVRRAVSS